MPSYCSVFWRLWGCCHQRPHCRQHLHGQHLSQRTAGQTLTLLLRTDRNLVKALPWFQSVREKLLDPAYSSWFLRFDPKRKGNYSVATNSANITAQCDKNYDPPICSDFYHDQEQTPSHGEAHPDGNCSEPCDCGEGLPCGEYLWDHRNGSMLQKWLVDEYILGPDGVGNDNITGVFIDDYWCYGEGCHDPVAGASEIDKNQQADMGLSDDQIKAISVGWRANMEAVHKALLAHKAFAWDLFPNQHNAGCGAGPEITKANCHATLSRECSDKEASVKADDAEGGLYRSQALYYGLQRGDLSAPTVNARLPDLAQDLASFLIVRGDFAWLGYGFLGCAADANYTQPLAFSEDYGVPPKPCHPVAGKPGVYAREYSRANVTLDCNEWKGTIVMTDDARMVDLSL